MNSSSKLTQMIVPLILAGGAGSRLWPLSRQHHPKQTLRLIDNYTLLQTTFNHLEYINDIDIPIIISHEDHRFIIAEQIRQLNKKAIILLEKKSLNTAAAVTTGTLLAIEKMEDPLILVMPSDHYISDSKKFADMIMHAIPSAKAGNLVTFGIQPLSAKTDYGYIKKGAQLNGTSGYNVLKFVEKPNFETAQAFVSSREYYWNSGIFLFQASTFVGEMEKYAPQVLTCTQKALKNSKHNHDFIFLGDEFVQHCPNLPIDKAIFENTKKGVVFPFACEWRDIGDWEALYQIGKKDKSGNVVHGNVVTFDTESCYLYSNKPLIVTSGIKDCIVVATTNSILVARLDKKQDIKKIVDYLIDHHYWEATQYAQDETL